MKHNLKILFSVFLRLLVLLFLLRVIFLTVNREMFANFKLEDWFIGTYIDAATLGMTLFPFVVLFLFPLPSMMHSWRSKLMVGYVLLLAFLFIVSGFMDTAYFSYLGKRVSFGYLIFMFTNPDTNAVAGDFIMEFWWLLLLLVFVIYSTYRWLIRPFKMEWFPMNSISSWAALVVFTALSIFVGRGGWRLKPVHTVDAAGMTSLENSYGVVNSPFVLLKTQDLSGIRLEEVIPEEEAIRLTRVSRILGKKSILPKGTNVVILILESFSGYYVGPEEKESFTPFLDSLSQTSLYFPYALANASTSMDAIPAITSGLPTWMEETFILSEFNVNCFEGLPRILKEYGYSSSFYHGAKTGSMFFDSFAKTAGFDVYSGKEQYPDQSHDDGNWGIWDHLYLPWYAQQLSQHKQPFVSTTFTLSSHHPFFVPKSHEKLLRKGSDPLMRTINYTDLSLRDFWTMAKKQAWFNNTLFIFVADHVGPTQRTDKKKLVDLFEIPVLIHHPKMDLSALKKGEEFQQIDILPTVVDALGVNRKVSCFGRSYFSERGRPKWIYRSGQVYRYESNKAWKVRKSTPKPDERYALSQLQLYQKYLMDNGLCP